MFVIRDKETDLVSFKIAEYCKKIGLVIYSDYCYDPFSLRKDYLYYYCDEIFCSTEERIQRLLFAPKKEHLLRVLREEKKVIVNVQPIDSWNCWSYSILMQDIMSPFYQPDYNKFNEYETYDKALEEGLFKALELI